MNKNTKRPESCEFCGEIYINVWVTENDYVAFQCGTAYKLTNGRWKQWYWNCQDIARKKKELETSTS